ncbi:AI-2E family transporter [Bradyrhizobium tropiciagri]|uniref:AI-2E family transporter n=1 Tax=Bradyrhizobium tropiciagri TaxID=312253 RepID=UPI001BA5FD8A|nr:AI-2E family transporter [Bradyrhizobium tropiciagri]MBR0900203.1 AI-2E family transporter [Bradyrhizobium tropiciagri]
MKTLRQLVAGDEFIQLAIRLGLLALLIYWSFVLVRPFVPILTWSVVLAVALNPVFNWLAGVLGGRAGIAALVLTLISLGVVIGPATWLGIGAVEGVREIAGQLSAGNVVVPSPPAAVKDWPLIGAPLYDFWDRASTNLRAVLREVVPHLKPLAGPLLGFASNAGVGMLKFLLAVVLAGFLFPYGSQLAAACRSFLSRIVPEQSEHFLDLAGTTIRAVSRGVIGIAVLQSLLAGIGFKLAGIPSAGLLAFVVMLLAIVQIGAAIVLIPVIIWLWSAKDFTTALALTLFFLVVGVLDNVLKPLVMGRGLTTPAPVILVGVIGGTLAHGIVGLFIGPIILAVAWEFITAWIRDDRARLAGER